MEAEWIFHEAKPGIAEQRHSLVRAVYSQHIFCRMPDERSDLMTKGATPVAPADIHMWSPTYRPYDDSFLMNFRLRTLSSQVHHVNVCSEPDVVRQIPAGMVGIFVEDDIVGVP
jgi:hypothetical protein